MEAFSLLKYWRGGGGSGVDNGLVSGDNVANVRNTAGTTTIVTTVAHQTNKTDEEANTDDDGPFFDLEFAVHEGAEEVDEETHEAGENAEEEGEEEEEEDDNDDDDEDDVDSIGSDGEEEREFNFTLSSGSSGGRIDPNLSLSPSDDLFFKGKLVPVEPSSLEFNQSEPHSKSPQFPVTSLLKSATKFRVFMLGLKKSKSNPYEKLDSNGSATATATPKQKPKPEETQPKDQNQSKHFTLKFNVEEVPIVSLFTRDNSSRINSAKKQNADDSASDEKRFSKEVMQKYLNKVKPLYVRVSKRYGEKLKFSGQVSLGAGTKSGPPPAATTPPKSTAAKSELSEGEAAETPVAINVKNQKQGNLPAGLRVVCKHLGKSRSASSAVAAMPPGPVLSRRDDSLLQQQDGIQSAILHCKKSFNGARDSESSILSRSASDPSSQEKSIKMSRSSEEAKEDCV